MKPLRVLWLACALSAQTPEQNDVVKRVHKAFDDFACLANQWSSQHDDLISSRQDSERLAKALKAFEKFRRLAKDAQLAETIKKGKVEH